MEKFLSDICKIQYGYAFDSNKFSMDKGMPLIRIRDIVRGFSETYTTEKCDDEYIVQDGDILIGMDGEFNIACWKGGKAYLNQRVCRLIPNNDIDALYLFYFMPKALKAIEDKTPFVTVKHLSAKELNKIIVPIPSLEEQKAISKTLNKIYNLIELRRQQLSKLDELIKSRFVEMFGDPVKNDMGWESKPLNEVCDGIGDGLHGTPVYDDDGEYPFINGNNLIDGKIVITPATNMVSEEIYKKHLIDISTNAVLISINGTLGKLAFYSGEKVMLGKSACYCNLKQNINKVFVYWVMKNDSFAEFLESSSTKSTIKNVGLKAMREYKLILPPTEQQNQFATFVEQIDKSKLSIQQSLEKLEALKKSLMQQYFG